MSKKILVAVDRSSMGHQVFQEALALAKSCSGGLKLLHVLSADEEGSPHLPVSPGLGYYATINDVGLTAYQEQWELWEDSGMKLLQSFIDEATTAGIIPELAQTPGSPGRVICQEAREWGADLIVLGRRGKGGGISELLLGSVSNYVLHHTPCSIYIVHPKESE